MSQGTSSDSNNLRLPTVYFWMNGFMSSAAHFKEGEEPKEEAVFFKGRISRLSTAWTLMGLSREKKLNQSFAVEIEVQNRRLIFWLPGKSAVSGDTTPAILRRFANI